MSLISISIRYKAHIYSECKLCYTICNRGREVLRMAFKRLKTNFEISEGLNKAIDALEEGVNNHVLYIDCLQDEVQSECRYLPIEQQRQIIEYYCLRRW